MGATGSVLDEKDKKSSLINLDKKESIKMVDNNNERSKDNLKCFVVSLGFWPSNLPEISLPESFKLRISYESLDFIYIDNSHPIIQFPFQNIICWGSSAQNFQFKVFNYEKVEVGDKKENGILISLRTTQGRMIEEATMATVQKLMIDINSRAISKQEFNTLIQSIFQEDNEQLQEDWLSTIVQFTSTGRLFLARQGMDLLLRVGPLVPFEKFDLACLIYEKMIDKSSFQLIINTFDDEHERENLIHRLKLNKSRKEVVSTCTILPEA